MSSEKLSHCGSFLSKVSGGNIEISCGFKPKQILIFYSNGTETAILIHANGINVGHSPFGVNLSDKFSITTTSEGFIFKQMFSGAKDNTCIFIATN